MAKDNTETYIVAGVLLVAGYLLITKKATPTTVTPLNAPASTLAVAKPAPSLVTSISSVLTNIFGGSSSIPAPAPAAVVNTQSQPLLTASTDTSSSSINIDTSNVPVDPNMLTSGGSGNDPDIFTSFMSAV